MTKEKYHHGDLKRELLKKGLQLLNKEGYEGFSLRKVAVMCNVSHAAPYKHFKSKEELIGAIVEDVTKSFTAMIEEVVQSSSADPEGKLIEIGKRYVAFMVNNPDYFRFIFLTDHHNPIAVKDDVFIIREGHPFNIIKKCADDYFSSFELEQAESTREVLALWSLIQGYTVLIIHNTISYSGDYLELVEMLLRQKFNSSPNYTTK